MLKRQDALKLVRSIAQEANIEIKETQDGPNTRVELVLAPDVEIVPASLPGTIPSPDRRYRVLHVEDIGRTADLVYYYLRSLYDVETVLTAEEALETALKQQYDFVLVDLKLGAGMDGLELTTLLRKTERYSWTPIIAVTGLATQRDVDRSMTAGCSAFLSKPFLKSDLLRILQQLEERIIKPRMSSEVA
jgi:two-component system, sensor histidine kinase